MVDLNQGKIVVHCPNCGKEYDMDDYKKLKKSDSEELIDRFDNEVYDARICSVCRTEFGFVRIVRKEKNHTIFQIDLDLIEPKEEMTNEPVSNIK